MTIKYDRTKQGLTATNLSRESMQMMVDIAKEKIEALQLPDEVDMDHPEWQAWRRWNDIAMLGDLLTTEVLPEEDCFVITGRTRYFRIHHPRSSGSMFKPEEVKEDQ